MEFFNVMLVHDLQCSEMLREQLFYRCKIKSQKNSVCTPLSAVAASDITANGRSTPRELPTSLITGGRMHFEMAMKTLKSLWHLVCMYVESMQA